MTDLFDIVIPVLESSIGKLQKQLRYTKKYINGYRNIYIITDASANVQDCIKIDPSIFPFNKTSIDLYHGISDYNQTYVHQLYMIYAGFMIPDILNRYLVLDVDTYFLKSIDFVVDGKCVYTSTNSLTDDIYQKHMSKVHKKFKKLSSTSSGNSYHMIFEKPYLLEMLQLVENDSMVDFWIEYIASIRENGGIGACLFEMYYNFIVRYHSNDVIFRKLEWACTDNFPHKTDYDFVHICL